VEGVNASIAAVKEQVIRLSSERLRRTKRGQIALTERQMRLVEFINQNSKISVGDVADMFSVSRQAALKEIAKLVELKIVELKGKGRGAHYVLV